MGLNHMRWARRKEPKCVSWTYKPPADDNMGFIVQPTWKCPRDQPPLVGFFHPELNMTLTCGCRRSLAEIWSTGLRGWWEMSRFRNTRHKRCSSEPPLGSFTVAMLGGDAVDKSFDPPRNRLNMEIMYPRMSLAQIDRRSRRRSLSRSCILDMFDQSPGLQKRPDKHPRVNPPPDCQNCLDHGHKTSLCPLPCGYCGAPRPPQYPRAPGVTSRFIKPPPPGVPAANRFRPIELRHQNPHHAPQCPVAPHNRCKCAPFPVFHVAARCAIPCRRDCQDLAGNKHRVAMLCKVRCCMCGLRGHSGKECRQKRCRCGGAHLGQDCSWNPTCRVPGCDRFLCGLHCRGCGSRERLFGDWRCAGCRGKEGLPFPEEEEPRGRRRRRRGEGEAEAVKTVEENYDTTDSDATVCDSTESNSAEKDPAAAQPSSIFGGPQNADWETDGFTCKAWARGRNDKYKR